MKWSKEPPTRPGPYWWRFGAYSRPEPLIVRGDLHIDTPRGRVDVGAVGGEWMRVPTPEQMLIHAQRYLHYRVARAIVQGAHAGDTDDYLAREYGSRDYVVAYLREALMPRMEWTREPPTEPGWYWVDDPRGTRLAWPRIVEAEHDRELELVVRGLWSSLANVDLRWCRIPEPQEGDDDA